MPALGIAAKFYQRFALALCEQGLHVSVLEQRGHGDSPIRPLRQQSFGFAEILSEDIPAALDWTRHELPACRRILIGHNLGGHLAAMSAGLYPAQIDGVVLTACGSPWRGAYQGLQRAQLEFLNLLIRPLTTLFGYYHGQWLGFGGREVSRLMSD